MMRSKLVDKIVETENCHTDDTDFFAGAEEGRIYSFLNPVSYMKALKHQDLFCQMDGLFADGAILVAAIWFFHGRKVTRRSCDMTSLAPMLLKDAADNKKTVYMIGAKQNEVAKAVTTLCEHYKGVNIIGYRNGYFASEHERDDEIRHIVTLNPDLLIVGMGAVRQEQFLLKVKEAGFQGDGFTCGGFIHQTANDSINYYPTWMNKMNLRFVYRMWKEPHTRKQYLRAAFIFPIKFVREKFFG